MHLPLFYETLRVELLAFDMLFYLFDKVYNHFLLFHCFYMLIIKNKIAWKKWTLCTNFAIMNQKPMYFLLSARRFYKIVIRNPYLNYGVSQISKYYTKIYAFG